MTDTRAPGREIAKGEGVEAELDRLIQRRHEQRRKSEPECEMEAAWMESERAHNARRREENRAAWCEYHRGQAERHKRNLEALVAEHEAAAKRLAEETEERIGA